MLILFLWGRKTSWFNYSKLFSDTYKQNLRFYNHIKLEKRHVLTASSTTDWNSSSAYALWMGHYMYCFSHESVAFNKHIQKVYGTRWIFKIENHFSLRIDNGQFENMFLFVPYWPFLKVSLKPCVFNLLFT